MAASKRQNGSSTGVIPYGRGESLFVATGEGSDPDALTTLLFKRGVSWHIPL